MSARLIPPPQVHLHRITQYSQKNDDTRLLRAPSELSVNRTKASVRTVLGRALVRRREPRCASYTNTAVPVLEFSSPVAVPPQYGTVESVRTVRTQSQTTVVCTPNSSRKIVPRLSVT